MSEARRNVALGGVIALAVLVPCFMHGGYTPAARAVFAALAGAAFLLASSFDESGARALLRKPPVAILFALAAVGLLSATWTVAEPQAAVRWAFMVAGYAALAVAAGVLVRRPRGLETCVGVICAVAAVAAMAGAIAFAMHDAPWAERLAKSWRPEGPFEYPPALALVQVAALPGYLMAMTHLRRSLAAGAAAAAALAVAILALSSSRAELAFGVLVLASALVAPRHTIRTRPALAVAAVVAAAAGGIAAYGATRLAAHGSDGARLLGIAAAVALTALAWAIVRTVEPRLRLPRAPRAAAVASLTVVALLGLVGAAALGQGGIAPKNGVAHGRTDIWRAAAKTAGDHPVHGAGADAFLTASVIHQGTRPTRYAHSLPLELAAELGIAGALLALALYGTVLVATWRAAAARGAWLVVPAVLAFLTANLVDWEWHEAAVGAVWAVALGALLALASGGRPARSG